MASALEIVWPIPDPISEPQAEKEDDALGAFIGFPHAAHLSGACRRVSFSRPPRFVSLQMEVRDPQ